MTLGPSFPWAGYNLPKLNGIKFLLPFEPVGMAACGMVNALFMNHSQHRFQPKAVDSLRPKEGRQFQPSSLTLQVPVTPEIQRTVRKLADEEASQDRECIVA